MQEQDLKQIQQIIDRSIDGLVSRAIKLGFDGVNLRLDKVEDRLDAVESGLNQVKADVKRLPDKDYLDKKFFELKSDLILKIQNQEKKINFLINIFKKHKLLTATDEQALKEFDVYPSVTH